MNEVKLQIESLDAFSHRTMEMAKRLDEGERIASDSHVSFETMEGLLKVLSPNRWVLLRTLRHRGPSSIRALARDLDRDYRGVHADVAMLVEAGLVERNRKGAVSVPWSRITAEMALDAAA